jgi:hypothetical protein
MYSVRQSRSSPLAGALLAVVAAAALIISGAVQAQQRPPAKMPLPKADPPLQRIITQGPARTVTEDLVPCGLARPGMNVRKNPVGEITAKDGTRLVVPTANSFQAAPKLPDL